MRLFIGDKKKKKSQTLPPQVHIPVLPSGPNNWHIYQSPKPSNNNSSRPLEKGKAQQHLYLAPQRRCGGRERERERRSRRRRIGDGGRRPGAGRGGGDAEPDDAEPLRGPVGGRGRRGRRRRRRRGRRRGRRPPATAAVAPAPPPGAGRRRRRRRGGRRPQPRARPPRRIPLCESARLPPPRDSDPSRRLCCSPSDLPGAGLG